MSYQIKQIQGDNISPSDRFTSITNFNINDQLKITDDIFNEKGLMLIVGQGRDNFSTRDNYYLNFSLYRLNKFETSGQAAGEGYTLNGTDYSNIDFSVYLIKPGSQQDTYDLGEIIGNFTLPSYEKDSDNKEMNFSVLFSPLQNNYSALGFIIKRTNYDYSTNAQGRPRNLNFVSNSTTLGIINNLLPTDIKVDKIGVQAKPGFFMCINGEPIRVGRTGIYEIHNGYQVKSFGTPLTTEHFILDYAYDSQN